MQDTLIVLVLYSILGMAVCYNFRREFRHWAEQTIVMKGILLIIAGNTAGAILCTLIVLSTLL